MSMICACMHEVGTHGDEGPCRAHGCSCLMFRFSAEAGIVTAQREITDSLSKLVAEQKAALKDAHVKCALLLEAATTGAEWMRWWLEKRECECEDALHSCGRSDREKELARMEQIIRVSRIA